jgi:CRISPR-associated protein Cas9/Csn1, subtype II/NMEMI
MAKKYLLGLDLGTDSVGWCLMDESNHIIKKGGKSLWGVRLFEEAEDCSSRRMSRESRRRTQRRAERVDLLQSLFAPEMAKVDPTFFVRMNNSALLEEDKETAAKGKDGTLFAGVGGINDKAFYDKFPTIYHLRDSLLTGEEKADIRYLYLVCHHMVKYRGNFLHYGEEINLKSDQEIIEAFHEIDVALEKMAKKPLALSEERISSFLKLALNSFGINDSKRAYYEFLKQDDSFIKNGICPLLAGGKVAVSKLYDLDEDDEPDPKNISVRSSTFEDDFSKLNFTFSDRPETAIIKAAKTISDFILLRRILGSSNSLSDAMVARFNLHKTQLKELKSYVRSHCPELYDRVFRTYDPKVNNYVRYVGMTRIKGKRLRVEHCHREEFYDFVKTEVFKIAKNVEVTDPFVQGIVAQMDNGDYLPRQNSTDNGVFPYQLNLTELKCILDKQAKFYPFLKVKDEEGYSTDEKIISILTYHIPYYVGPLVQQKEGDEHGKFAWVVRTGKKIMPWNFQKGGIIDFDQSAENFIRRMLNKCTYLPNCYCLPKCSLLYSRFEVISFLNNIAINGRPIPAHSTVEGEVSKDLLMSQFCLKGTLTVKGLTAFLKNHFGHFDPELLTTRTGKEIDSIDASMKSYADFVGIFGQSYVEQHLDLIESIINDLSIFTDRDIVERRLRNKYGFTNEKVIRQIKALNYSKFGRLSKELLELTSDVPDLSTGEIRKQTLIDSMYESGENLMEILADSRYSFGAQVAARQKEASYVVKQGASKLEQVKAVVDELYVSPSLKRPLLQAYEVVDELQKIVGHPIDEYYVECTRGSNPKEKGKKKPSRLEDLLRIYGRAKTDSVKLLKELEKKENPSYFDQEMKKQILENGDSLDRCFSELKDQANRHNDMCFRSDKLFFYYTQLGRCMYSLKPIHLEDLFADAQQYDIDHIVPQSLVKDDSLENRVLVYQDYNRKKADVYPLPSGFLAPGAASFYRYLSKIGLIGEKKLGALLRSSAEPLKDEELVGFTNRQLVSTNQAVKGLITILTTFEKVKGKEPEVIFSKAGLVSDFRQKFDILKSRDANDFHHAHDAYLNVVVGRANHEYFRYMNGRGWFEAMHRSKLSTNPSNIFDQNSKEAQAKGHVKAPIKDSQGNICWAFEPSLEQIKRDIYHRFDIMVTVRQFIQPGLFGKATLLKKTAWRDGNLFPIKNNRDPAKYGGYYGLNNGFFTIVELFDKKGKPIPTLIPVLNISARPDEEDKILHYCSGITGQKVGKLLVPCLRINSVIKKGKVVFLLSGKDHLNSASCKTLTEMIFSQEEIRVIRSVSKLCEIIKLKRTKDFSPDREDFDEKLASLLGSPLSADELVISPAANDQRNKAICLTSKEELELYDTLLKKLSSPFFEETGGPSDTAALMADPQKRALFESLSIGKKALVLSEILKETSANSAERANLKLLNGPAEQSKRLLSWQKIGSCQVLAQSVTGFYEKTIFPTKQK